MPEAETKQVPSIGRVVHYVRDGAHLAAIVTHPAWLQMDPLVGARVLMQVLTVFPPHETPFTTVASEDPAGVSGTWHWPEYVPAVKP